MNKLRLVYNGIRILIALMFLFICIGDMYDTFIYKEEYSKVYGSDKMGNYTLHEIVGRNVLSIFFILIYILGVILYTFKLGRNRVLKVILLSVDVCIIIYIVYMTFIFAV